MRKKIGKRYGIYLAMAAAAWVVIPPLFHKTAAGRETVRHDEGKQERICSIDDNMDALLWRLRLIEEAQENVILYTFDFRDDDSPFSGSGKRSGCADYGGRYQWDTVSYRKRKFQGAGRT